MNLMDVGVTPAGQTPGPSITPAEAEAMLASAVSALAPAVAALEEAKLLHLCCVHGFDEMIGSAASIAAIHTAFGVLKKRWPELRTIATWAPQLQCAIGVGGASRLCVLVRR